MNPRNRWSSGSPGNRFTWIGGWLFKHRTAVPIPIAAILLLVPPRSASRLLLLWIGVAIVTLGELIRVWAVRHIGVISRTRSDRLGRLVSTGPFARVRNPLYIGNLLLWIGFTLSSQLLWLLPPIVALVIVEYHAIVTWEESLLESRLGDAYRAYTLRVPRWIPRAVGSRQSPVGSRQSPVGSQQSQLPVASRQSQSPASAGSQQSELFSWRETLFSERGTLLAMAAGYLLLWLKTRL